METEAYHVHQFQETVVPPTCKTNGYTLYRCHCGYEHRTNFKPLGTHNYAVTESIPATCETNGSITWQCATCGETVTQTVPPLGHDYTPWIVEAYPTCQQPGMQFRTCSRCGAREEAALPPTGHRCVPGTEQYTGGKLTAFFCENCGQVIPVAEAVPDTPVREGRYLPTKGIAAFMLLTILLNLISTYAFDSLPHVTVVFPAPILARLLFLVLWGGLILKNVDPIKSSPHFPPWLGALTLGEILFWAFTFISFLIEQGQDKGFPPLTMILPFGVLMGIPLLFTVVCLKKSEKKPWIFGIIAVGACGLFAFIADGFARILEANTKYNLWHSHWEILYICTNYLCFLLPLFLMAAITAPGKQTKK